MNVTSKGTLGQRLSRFLKGRVSTLTVEAGASVVLPDGIVRVALETGTLRLAMGRQSLDFCQEPVLFGGAGGTGALVAMDPECGLDRIAPLLRLEPGVEYAVVEMGAGKVGDISWLCELGRPTVSLLLTVMPAHLQGFGTLEDIANAKGEIFDGLGQGDCAVINADLPWAASWRERAGAASVIDFGLEKSAAITASDVRPLGVKGVSFTAITPAGSMAVTLALPGVHNVANALATTAVALACGLDLTQIRSGLEAVQPTAGRLATAYSPVGSTVIDDCYNANPGSVRAAISMLAGCEGRRTLVLGAMRELGPGSEALHREIGEYARAAGIERFWGVGPELQVAVDAFGSDACWFADCESAIDATAGEFNSDDTVLVKGSRGARMERVLHALLASAPAGEG